MSVSSRVRRKNVYITLWLLAPFVVVTLLMVMIFVSQNKERLMDDAKPIGAGAGDTGNANAIGEWLFGNDPDAISLATRAKREGLMIAPTDWPGGVSLSIPSSALPDNAQSVYLTIIHKAQGRYTTTGMRLDEATRDYETLIDHDTLKKGSRFVVSTSLPTRRGDGLVDDQGRALRLLSLSPQLPPGSIEVEDPLPVRLPIDSVYEDASP